MGDYPHRLRQPAPIRTRAGSHHNRGLGLALSRASNIPAENGGGQAQAPWHWVLAQRPGLDRGRTDRWISTGQVAAGVKEITDGAQLYIQAAVNGGGVNGQNWNSFPLDDKFDPLAAENARKLIEENNVSAMFLTRALPTQAMIPLLENTVWCWWPLDGAPWCTSRCPNTSSTCAPPTSARPKRP